MKFKLFYLYLFLNMLSVSMPAQSWSSIRSIGIEQGLSNNFVVSITQDRKGFVWFATESGLNRFDGKQFQVYKKYSSGNLSISGNELNKICSDSTEDAIWIATQRSGLNRFDCKTETFSLFMHDDNNEKSIASDAVTDICNDADGNIWIGTYSNGVDLYDRKKNEFIHFNRSTLPGWVSDNVWSIAEDMEGKLYIGHVNEGLSVLSPKDRSVKHYIHDAANPHSLPNNTVRVVFIDNTGNVWVGTDDGLAIFYPEKERFIIFRHHSGKPQTLISNRIMSICQSKDNQLWIGTENGGISVLHPGKEMYFSSEDISFRNIYPSDDETGLSSVTVRAVFQDKFDNIWIGMYGGGVNFIGKNPDLFLKWQYHDSPRKNSLTNKTAWGMCEDSEGNIWIGTDGGGICEFHNSLRANVYTKEGKQLNSNAILSALRDSEGNLWFGTFLNGIMFCEGKTKQFKPFLPGIFGKTDIRCLYEDENKTVWIGTGGQGLFSYHLPTQTLKNFTARTHHLPGDDQIRTISKDAQGRLWTGSFGSGMTVLDTDFRQIAVFHREAGFYSNAITFIFKDSQQRMWVGTGEGLVFFPQSGDLSAFTIFTERNGLKDSYIRAIAEDRNGNIWFSSNGGISKYNLNEGKFYNYDYSDGLPIGQFMDGSVINSQSGWLYFGSQNGVCCFDPGKITDTVILPPVTITGLKYFTSLKAPENEECNLPISNNFLQLKYNQNTLTFHYNVMDYAFSDQAEYAYRMAGIWEEWYSTGKSNEATFRNLPAGTYVFSVRARLNNQDWSNETASFTVKINPPFYLSRQAKMIYSLIIAVIAVFIILFIKRRIQLENLLYLEKQNNLQQETLNNERLQFFTNITHELRTPLTLIIGPLEDLKAEDSLTEKTCRKVSLIHQNAVRLLDLLNKILDFRKTETRNIPLKVVKGDIAELVWKIGLKYRELNQNRKIKFLTSIETGNTCLYFDADKVIIILDNLISNAFKFTDEGEIRLALREITREETVYTELEVADTGCGIPKDELEKIFERYYQIKNKRLACGTGIGLSLVKNLTSIHQGTITVESKEGQGTSFKFRLQTDNIYPEAIHQVAENEDTPDSLEMETGRNEQEIKTGKQIILAVEDNTEILYYIQDAFDDDYTVLKAEDGQTGLEKALSHVPDVIISDIMMPGMSGLELCEALKKDVRTCHIPVILLTAKTSMQDKTEGYQSGADSYITKPFSATLLRSRVINLLESRKNLAKQIINSKTFKQTLLNDSLNQLDNDFLEKTTRIIKENIYSEELNIEFIAQQVCMSHSTLYRKIKALTGLTINEFIRKIKMKYAEELLLTGKYTVSEIACKAGFNEIAYFRHCFKDEFGITPADYVKKLKG